MKTFCKKVTIVCLAFGIMVTWFISFNYGCRRVERAHIRSERHLEVGADIMAFGINLKVLGYSESDVYKMQRALMYNKVIK